MGTVVSTHENKPVSLRCESKNRQKISELKQTQKNLIYWGSRTALQKKIQNEKADSSSRQVG